MSSNVPNKPPGVPDGPPQAAAPWVRLQCDGEEGPTSRTVAASVVLIGSRRDCDLPVTHPNVSKVHCALINTGRGILARDLISRCGTFLNDQPIRTAVLDAGGVLRLGSVVVGFEFLAPSDGQAGPAHAARDDGPATVAIRGQILPLADNALVIGRRNTADVVVDTPDTSLAHALLFSLNGRPAIQDLGSRSGTWVDGERVELAWLSNGAEIGVGGERFTVCWEEGAVEEESAVAAEQQAQAGGGKTASPAAPSVGQPPALENAPATLDELEQMVAAVHSHLAAARGRLDERSRELDELAARVKAEQAEAQSRAAGLAEREAEVGARQAQLSQVEQELAQRRAELEEQARQVSEAQSALQAQRAEVEALTAQVNDGRKALEAEHAALAQQRSELDQARAAFERDQQAIKEAREACRKMEEELQARAAEMTGQATKLEQERAELAVRQSELEATQAAQADWAAQLKELEARLGAREAALKSELNELLGRETALTKRAAELDAREAAIAAQEAQNADVDHRIREFKTALMRAGELFSRAVPDSAAPVSRAVNAEKEPALSPDNPERRGGDGTRAGEATGQTMSAGNPATGAPAGSNELDDLPAPIVDKPLFSADAVPADWPPKLRERFRVLRRVSRKSDAELAEQVWAERERVLAAPPQPSGQGKRKRRFWGN